MQFPRLPRKVFKRTFVTQFVLTALFVTVVVNIYFTSWKLDQAQVTRFFTNEIPRFIREGIVHRRQSVVENLEKSARNRELWAGVPFGDSAYYDFDRNVVGTTTFGYNQYQRQPYVANGYLGARVANAGQGFAYDEKRPDDNDELVNAGWPLFNKRYSGAFIAGFYNSQQNTTGNNFPELSENGWDSFIAAIPQWTTLRLTTTMNDKEFALDPSGLYVHGQTHQAVSNYMQNMSLSDGVVVTSFRWLDRFDVAYTVLAHREHRHLGVVRLDIESVGDDEVEVVVEDVLDFATSQRCASPRVWHDDDGIGMAFSPSGLPDTQGVIFSRLDHTSLKPTEESTTEVTQYVNLRLGGDNKRAQLTKYVGVASSDVCDDPEAVARQTATESRSFDATVAQHRQAWARAVDVANAVEFGGSDLVTLAARASLFHLAANTRPDAHGVSSALGVAGLSSDSYAGQVFWDADVWMLHGMLPFAPSHAEQIVNYRLATREQAVQNVLTGARDYHGDGSERLFEGAVYPWTSGRFGNCTATGPCFDYEYHINHAVAQAGWGIYLQGSRGDDYLREVVWPVMNDAARFFVSLVKYNDSLKAYTTTNLTDPDEYANHVDNGAYTNAGIRAVLGWTVDVARHLGQKVPDKYADVRDHIHLPEQNGVTLEFSGMDSSAAIKQADVIMLTYPLFNDQADGMENMQYYATKQVSYGPGMTFPIFSAVASQLSTSGCSSQSYILKSIAPYLRGPFAQFSEQNDDDYTRNQGTHPAFPFLTGHGGFLQAIFHGLTGFRPTYNVSGGQIERMLHVDPVSIECIGNNAKFSGVQYMNQSLTVVIDGDEFRIVHEGAVRGASAGPIRVQVGHRNDRAGVYTLKPKQTLVVPVYIPGDTYKGSISECSKAVVSNITWGMPGDDPSSINDGDPTSRWYSWTKNSTTKLLVDLLDYRNVTSLEFNFANKPPKSVSVTNYNGDFRFDSTSQVLSAVNFGEEEVLQYYSFVNPSGRVYPQKEVFDEVLIDSAPVKISAPYTKEIAEYIGKPTLFNTTKIDLESRALARFLLIETEGTHDADYAGPKFSEIIVR
ncbi:cell wall acid trehalase Atc1p [Diutina catenulata]